MKVSWHHLILVLALVLFAVGQYQALVTSPAPQFFGEVGRILYVHVPAAWTAMLAFIAAFVGAIGYLFTGRRGFDWLNEAGAEVGVVLGLLLCVLGAIFAKPTWGAYWSWDPRLTSTAVMVLTFFGVLVLRSLVADPDRRARWSAVVAILATVNVPITYYSVNWWRGMHQLQSTGGSMDPELASVLWMNTYAFLAFMCWFLVQRWKLAQAAGLDELPPPLPEVAR